MAKTSASARPLTDHEEIREWAEQRGATPSGVRGTSKGEDIGMIRLDFPGYSGEGSLEEISWDDWFQQFDEHKLALLVQDETAKGQQSNFNKLVSRKTAEKGKPQSRRAQSDGMHGRSASATASRASSPAKGRRRVSSRSTAKGSRSKASTQPSTKKNAGSARTKGARSNRSSGRHAA
jgi:hypothetical protein